MDAQRAKLIALLSAYEPVDPREREHLERMRGFAGSLAEPYSDREPTAHFTGSALVVDPTGTRTCLVFHRRLERWLQPGGHAEPEDGGDLAATALREAREETGMRVRLHPAAPFPFDVDVHEVPARKRIGPHLHLDVRALAVADDPEALAHDPSESHDAKWVPLAEALAETDDPSIERMLRKAAAVAPAGVR